MEQSQNKSTDSSYSNQKGFAGKYANGSLIEKADAMLSQNPKKEEGLVTKSLENQTAKIPSGYFLSLAIGSMAISAIIAATTKRKDVANFVGLWAPSFLMLGLYNKIVKTVGSDQQTR